MIEIDIIPRFLPWYPRPNMDGEKARTSNQYGEQNTDSGMNPPDRDEPTAHELNYVMAETGAPTSSVLSSAPADRMPHGRYDLGHCGVGFYIHG
jgi:hypothetical protein